MKDEGKHDDDDVDDDDEEEDEDDEQVNTTSCKPDDFLPLARERYHPHKALNPVKCKIPKSFINTNHQIQIPLTSCKYYPQKALNLVKYLMLIIVYNIPKKKELEKIQTKYQLSNRSTNHNSKKLQIPPTKKVSIWCQLPNSKYQISPTNWQNTNCRYNTQ